MIEKARERVIFALDTGESIDEALWWVDLLQAHIGMFKVGKEAYTRFGPAIVEAIRGRGGKVFLDLKFHDIPNTVARAAEAAAALGISMFNVHALGGRRMMEATARAVKALAESKNLPVPVMLAVTILTSLDESDIEELGFRVPLDQLTINLAGQAKKSGMNGVVASAREVGPIRKACGRDFILVTPGIRWDESEKDDQSRVATPREAIRNGADYLVIGRPIRTARDPVSAVSRITEEIAEGLKLRAN